jgi:hypothetical protein
MLIAIVIAIVFIIGFVAGGWVAETIWRRDGYALRPLDGYSLRRKL